ncbi:hypothetical protein [Thermosulfurimonas sp. F29]|uniref:hypothetical protein n=1 Tax=Thermosulfurimonas sp. F29 TaxID=2867247 RepID=UPI001C83DA6F|nr:hypothetical protein [Thermosulfurimonas sp. F29]MBX6422238.1 hypothetical protein [Thermosulfurimonas sp. F29]
MNGFLKILNMALSSPLYFRDGMFTPYKGPPQGIRRAGAGAAGTPPEFVLWGKSPQGYYRHFTEPERFYRGLIVDRTI